MVFPELHSIGLFALVALTLIVIPGPAVLYVITRSVEQGTKAGLVSVLGIGAGALFHVIGAALGISALFVTSAVAFNLFKLIGGIYLIYLGLKRILAKGTGEPSRLVIKKQSLSKVFYQGLIVNLLNPKTSIFFLAFLPQFISLERGQPISQTIFLGLLFVLLAVISDSVYVLISTSLSKIVRHNSFYVRFNRYIIGAIYITLGLGALAFNRSQK